MQIVEGKRFLYNKEGNPRCPKGTEYTIECIPEVKGVGDCKNKELVYYKGEFDNTLYYRTIDSFNESFIESPSIKITFLVGDNGTGKTYYVDKYLKHVFDYDKLRGGSSIKGCPHGTPSLSDPGNFYIEKYGVLPRDFIAKLFSIHGVHKYEDKLLAYNPENGVINYIDHLKYCDKKPSSLSIQNQAKLGDKLWEVIDFYRRNNLPASIYIETHAEYMIDRFRQGFVEKWDDSIFAQVLFFEKENEEYRKTPIKIKPNGTYEDNYETNFQKFQIKEETRNLRIGDK